MYKKLIVERTDSTHVQLLRSLFVGLAAAVVDFSVLILLKEAAGINYLVAASLSFVGGVAVNYFLSITWVFPVRKLKNAWHEFGLFSLIGAVGLLLTLIIMWFCTSVIGLFYIVSKLVATGMVYSWNFFSRKFLLFSARGANG